MNKYYTPTVEEIIPFILSEKYIHVVEYGESTKYYILHFQEDNIIDSIHQFIEMNDKDDKIYSINPEIYRVKYLDKEDINDLGFGFIEGEMPTKTSFYKIKDKEVFRISTYWDMLKLESYI